MDSKMIPIIIPSLEPDDRLITTIEKLYTEQLGPIVVVDDGSGSAYSSYFEEVQNKYGVVLLRHERNQGKGRALKTAFEYCLKHYERLIGVITADSDGQHTIPAIRAVRDELVKQPEKLILGSRDFSDKELVPAKSSFGNNLTSKVFRCLYGMQISDTQTGLRGIPREMMKNLLTVDGDRFEFETNMLIYVHNNGDELVEVPIETVYDSKEDHATHFNPVKDSIRIYKLFFGAFVRFLISGLSSSIIDLVLFSLACMLLRKQLPIYYVTVATIFARVVSATYNYCMNYQFVFHSKKSRKSTAFGYILLAVVQMMASAGLTTGLCFLLPNSLEVVVKILVDTCLFFASYQIQKRYVY